MNRTLAALAAAAVAVSANAVLVIDQDPGNPPGSENILFNDPSLISKGLLVQGMTNENFLFVDFFDAGEDLVTARASVMAVDGGMTQLSVAMNDPTLGISAYRFNLNALASGDVTINVFD